MQLATTLTSIQDERNAAERSGRDLARTPGGGRPPFTQKQWDTALNATTALTADVTGAAAAELRDGSAALAERFRDRARVSYEMAVLVDQAAN